MCHGHCHRQYNDCQDSALLAMAIVLDHTLCITIHLKGHCNRQYIDYQDAASWVMAMVTDNNSCFLFLFFVCDHGHHDVASWAMAMVTDNTLTIRMLLHGS